MGGPAAALATTTARRAINALQSARARRETYVGPWLPEPIDTSASDELRDCLAGRVAWIEMRGDSHVVALAPIRSGTDGPANGGEQQVAANVGLKVDGEIVLARTPGSRRAQHRRKAAARALT